jgi:hypothetical protein
MSKGRKKRKKNSPPTKLRIKWMCKEEECLAKAWKTVSMNGITGANQNYDTYWQRVKLAFDERKIIDTYFNKTVMIRGKKAMGTDEVQPRQCPCLRAFETRRAYGTRRTRQRLEGIGKHRFYPGLALL